MPDLTPEMQVRFLTYILESSSHVADDAGEQLDSTALRQLAPVM